MNSDHAREVYRELQKLARADYDGATGPLLVVYGVEGFLRAWRRRTMRRR